MNKYKQLALNTVIFTVGSFGSKIISLLMNNLYTKHISPENLYTKSLLENTALFLIPVFIFSMTEAIIRYGLDKKYDKKQVFTTASTIAGVGLCALTVVVPFLRFIPFFRQMKGYVILLMLYIIASCLRAICSQFVRAREMVTLFSLDGILCTLTLFIFNVIFISKLGLGVKGFMIASILSDGCSAAFLFVTAGLRRYYDLSCYSRRLGRSMLRFTIPLIPTTIIWTFTGFSDQLFISNLTSDRVPLGEGPAGLYYAATKIPNLLSMLSTIIYQSWNMSAITENESADRESFYGNVYSAYESALFVGSAGLILLAKPISAILNNCSRFPEYADAYKYTPLLIAAALFTCLDLFLASIYTATKQSKNAFVTLAAVAVINIIMNIIIIPEWGIQGAAFTTLFSYVACFWLRIIDSRYYIHFDFDLKQHLINSALLGGMCLASVFRPTGYVTMNILLTAAIVFFNYESLLNVGKKLLKRA